MTNAAMALALTCPQMVSADGFTAADVLGWTHEEQDAFFVTSFGMAGIVAMQTGQHDAQMHCIDDLFALSDEQAAIRNEDYREVFERFPELHPQALIMAIIERDCGSFALD
ncbi:MAG: hypothetical protein AAFQ58_22730 [Pseudomonadota bacterium]